MIDEYEDTYSSTNVPQMTLSVDLIKEELRGAFAILGKTCPSKEEMNNSHRIIGNMLRDQKAIDILAELLQQYQHNLEHPNIPKLIIASLNTYIRQQVSFGAATLRVDRTYLNNRLIALITSDSLDELYRLMVAKHYPQLIFASGMEHLRHKTIDAMCNGFSIIALSLPENTASDRLFHNSEQFRLLYSYLPLLTAMLTGPLESKYLRQVAHAFFQPLIMMARGVLESLQETILRKDEEAFMKITQLAERLISHVRMVFVKTDYETHPQLKEKLLQNKLIFEIAERVLKLGTAGEIQPQYDGIAQLCVPTGGNKYLARLNTIKSQVLDIITSCGKLFIKRKTLLQELQTQKYKQILKLFRMAIAEVPKALLKEFQALNYPVEEVPDRDLFKSALESLATLVRIPIFFLEAEELRDPLFCRLCLPLLHGGSKQLEGTASDYRSIRQDLLNTQSMDILQNSVCKLIEAFVDRVDGSIARFSRAVVAALNFQLTANPNFLAEVPSALVETPLFKGDHVRLAEVCLTVLSLMSYMAPGREDVVQMVEKLLITRQEFLFGLEQPGTLHCATFICYSYYVDNWYQMITQSKSTNRQFHRQNLLRCCHLVRAFTRPDNPLQGFQAKMKEIGALQALDCMSNSLCQPLLLPALFWNQQNQSAADTEIFLGLFRFLVEQLEGNLSVLVADLLIDFLKQALKNATDGGLKLRRFKPDFKDMAPIIQEDLTELLTQQILRLYKLETLPNSQLMKTKLLHLLQLVITIAKNPDKAILASSGLIATIATDSNKNQILTIIDVYARRLIGQPRVVNRTYLLVGVAASCANLLKEVGQSRRYKSLFGVLINLIYLEPTTVQTLARPISQLLVQLLDEEREQLHYSEELESVIDSTAYIALVALYSCFSEQTQSIWCSLVGRLYSYLREIASHKATPYVGKLLTLALLCLHRTEKAGIPTDPTITLSLWRNVLLSTESYSSLTEKKVTANLIIKVLRQRLPISQEDEQSQRCFQVVVALLLSASRQVKQEGGDVQSSDDQGLLEEGGLNYREYTVDQNQFIRNFTENETLELKQLCHLLRQSSSPFLLKVSAQLPVNHRNFLRDNVYYYEQNLQEGTFRKLLRTKKLDD